MHGRAARAHGETRDRDPDQIPSRGYAAQRNASPQEQRGEQRPPVAAVAQRNEDQHPDGSAHLGEHRHQPDHADADRKRPRHGGQQWLDVVNVRDDDADAQRHQVNGNFFLQGRTRFR